MKITRVLKQKLQSLVIQVLFGQMNNLEALATALETIAEAGTQNEAA